MPLTTSLRDEENERINTVLKQLIALVFVPDWDKQMVDQQLKVLDLSIDSLQNLESEALIQHLEKLNSDWENAEQFGDFLVQLSIKIENLDLKIKAISIYEYIQKESKTFSFGILGKIATAQK